MADRPGPSSRREDARDSDVESVGLLLVDDRGWIQLQQRDEGGAYPHLWATVGGALEPGEDVETGLRREVFEETGYRVLHEVKFGSRATVNLSDGRHRVAALFYAGTALFVACLTRNCSTF